MAEFLTMDEAKSKFGTKGRTNAGLTLGIIGTALAAFAGNNGGCGCGNGGGILGNLFGGNNNCCAMQAAENAKTLVMAQGRTEYNQCKTTLTCTLTLTAVLWLLTRESVTSLKF